MGLGVEAIAVEHGSSTEDLARPASGAVLEVDGEQRSRLRARCPRGVRVRVAVGGAEPARSRGRRRRPSSSILRPVGDSYWTRSAAFWSELLTTVTTRLPRSPSSVMITTLRTSSSPTFGADAVARVVLLGGGLRGQQVAAGRTDENGRRKDDGCRDTPSHSALQADHSTNPLKAYCMRRGPAVRRPGGGRTLPRDPLW